MTSLMVLYHCLYDGQSVIFRSNSDGGETFSVNLFNSGVSLTGPPVPKPQSDDTREFELREREIVKLAVDRGANVVAEFKRRMGRYRMWQRRVLDFYLLFRIEEGYIVEKMH